MFQEHFTGIDNGKDPFGIPMDETDKRFLMDGVILVLHQIFY